MASRQQYPPFAHRLCALLPACLGRRPRDRGVAGCALQLRRRRSAGGCLDASITQGAGRATGVLHLHHQLELLLAAHCAGDCYSQQQRNPKHPQAGTARHLEAVRLVRRLPGRDTRPATRRESAAQPKPRGKPCASLRTKRCSCVDSVLWAAQGCADRWTGGAAAAGAGHLLVRYTRCWQLPCLRGCWWCLWIALRASARPCMHACRPARRQSSIRAWSFAAASVSHAKI